jgi:hypothetical protein
LLQAPIFYDLNIAGLDPIAAGPIPKLTRMHGHQV